MRPLVLVHGFLGGSAQWAPQAPLGQARQFVAVDLPGFGQKAQIAPLGSVAEMADWVLGNLAERGIRRFDLLGHSMGGMIVQQMAACAPERVERLVLYATGALGVLPGRFEPIETSMARAREDGAGPTARRIAATWFREGAAAQAYPACAAIAERASLAAILAGLEAMRDWSGEAGLARITAPTLVLWGDRDRTYAWSQTERLWCGIPDSSLAVVPNAAHAVHMERPSLFNMLLDEYMGSL